MLLVHPPNAQNLTDVIADLVYEKRSREEVLSWQQAVFAECGFDIPIATKNGYWYFYSLMYLYMPFPYQEEGVFIRRLDLREYLSDLMKVPGAPLGLDLVHLRTHELDHDELLWPIAIIEDQHDLMAGLPSTRGVFEQHLDMLEHCHVRFATDHYLLVKQFDEQTHRIMVLGANRDPEKLSALMSTLGVNDFMFP
jgi:hypothetical protein